MIPRITKKGREKAEEIRLFAENWLTQRKDRWAGQPFVLEDWQYNDIILPLYGRLKPDGTRWYDRALIGLPRWNGKSSVVSLLCTNHLYLEPVADGEVYAVATTIPQANIVLGTVKGMVNANRELRAMTDVFRHELTVKESGCIFKTLAHDADTAQGFHPSFVSMDEMHVYKDRRMLEAMLSGMIGREQPLLVAITTAGESKSGVWWEIRKEWEKDPHALVVWYGASETDDPHDPRVWRKANPASWITDDMLESAYNKLPLSSFMRYHLNLATSGSYKAAIPAEVWMSDDNRRPPVYDPELPTYMAVDAADKRDRTSFTTVQVDNDGIFHLWADIRAADDHDRTYTDYLSLEEDIKRTATEMGAERIAFDRRQMGRSMQQLADERFPVEEFNQSNENMCAASQFLFELAQSNRLRHGGDPELASHIASAAAYERPPLGWRFAKSDRNDPHCKIDAAISTAMACWIAQASRPSVYESRGLLTI